MLHYQTTWMLADAPKGPSYSGNKRHDHKPHSWPPRWLALIVLCLGSLMIVLDSTIVNVVLPSIRADLGFSPTSLAWVVNVYPLTFGGFLLLGGRLCDNADAVSRKVLEESIASIGAAPAVCGDAPGAAEAARRARAPEHNSGPFRRSLLTSSGSSMPYYRDYRERRARP